MDPAWIELVRTKGPTAPEWSLAGRVVPAMVLGVYDGDTLTVALPIGGEGGGEIVRMSVRMGGIDTPEMKSKLPENRARAIRARNRLIQLCGVPGVGLDDALTKKEIAALCERHRPIVALECGPWDKYGRLMGAVRALAGVTSVAPGWEGGSAGDTRTFSQILIDERLAYAYGGATKLTEADQADALDG